MLPCLCSQYSICPEGLSLSTRWYPLKPSSKFITHPGRFNLFWDHIVNPFITPMLSTITLSYLTHQAIRFLEGHVPAWFTSVYPKCTQCLVIKFILPESDQFNLHLIQDNSAFAAFSLAWCHHTQRDFWFKGESQEDLVIRQSMLQQSLQGQAHTYTSYTQVIWISMVSLESVHSIYVMLRMVFGFTASKLFP